MWRRKYASNIYAGLLKSLREVQFYRSDLQPPILNEVDNLDEDSDSEENDSFEEELPLDLETEEVQESDELVVPFVALRRSSRIAEQNLL